MTRFLAVIGTVNHDVIVHRDGTRSESLGGILYNVLTLAPLLEGTGIGVRPFGRVGTEHLAEIRRLIAPYPHVDASGLIADPAGTNLSLLDYSAPGERVERVELRVAPLSPADVAGAAGAEAVLVNMISGRDLSPGTVAGLRARSRARFLLDVQALARTADAPRRPRVVPDRDAWCASFDLVRGNADEIVSFGGARELRESVRRILAAGPAEVLATLGDEGSLRAVAARGRGGEPALTTIPAFPAPGAVDPTGCGDSYLSGVCAAAALGVAPEDAPLLGAWTAAQVAALSGLDALAALRGGRERAAQDEPRLAALVGS
jgi:sugar/nucleoside kinase (ribokinase family)